MKVAECLVFEAMKEFNPELKNWHHYPDAPSFESLVLLDEATTFCAQTLYVTTYDMLLQNNEFLSEDSCIVCCGGSPNALPDLINAHLLMCSGAHIFTVFNALNRLFRTLSDWDAKLNAALLSDATAQTFIDISEHLFSNPVMLVTDALHIAAISQTIETSHPDIQFMQKNKYISQHMIQQLTSMSYLEKAESYHTIGFYYPPNYINCTIVLRKFDQNPWGLNIICCYGVNREPSNADLVLLDYLGKYILAAANHQQKLNSQISNRTSSFLYSLLTDNIENEAELESMAALLQFPINSKYQLYVILPRTPLESHLRYILTNLEDFLPSFMKLIYQNSVLILDRLADDGTGHERCIMDVLRLLLPSNNAFCGISQVFSDLRLLKDVYTLSWRTAKIGNQLHPKVVYYHFKDYYSYVLLSVTAQRSKLPLLYIEQLDRLMEYDERHHSNNIMLLRVLLESERNITAVSKKMHLHRNSVLYRVDKIEHMLNLPLDDPDVRMHLLLSFKAMDLIASAKKNKQLQ